MVATKTDPFDMFSSEAQRNHVLYKRMRLADPVHAAIHPQTGHTFWFLMRYDHCRDFLRDTRFGRDASQHSADDAPADQTTIAIYNLLNRNMLNLDGHEHARLKGLGHQAFSPTRVSDLRVRIQAIADRLLDAFDTDVADGDEFDLTAHYIEVLPLIALIEMFGLSLADYQQLRAWTISLLLASEKPDHETIRAFSTYLREQIDMRRGELHPPEGLLTTLIFAEQGGDTLSPPELLAMIFLLFTAGHETMVSFISNSIMSLMDHPIQMQLLTNNLDDRSIVKTAIEEMLRYNGPSYMTLPSWALEDIEIGGKVIRQGDVVHAVLHAANRDPEVFENPDNFDILRHPNKHLAFSNGIHHCLGAPLARLGGEIAITTLLRRIPLI